jgi:hypothetical protein
MSFSYLHDASPFPTAANNGPSVLTDQRMLIYKWWFEDQMKSHPDAETRNLSAGGVRIEGMPYADPEELGRLPKRRKEIDRLLARARRMAAEARPAAADVAGVVAGLTAELRGLVELSGRALTALDDLELRLAGGLDVSAVQLVLNGIDQRILEASSRQVVGFLLQPLITDIVQDDGWNRKKTPRAVLDTSRDLYLQIRESASYHLSLFERRFFRRGG